MNARTMPGLDVLLGNGAAQLKNKRVGLITNQTGVTVDGTQNADALLALGVNVKALFSPEHGIRGLLDTHVVDGRDLGTGLPIYSLYGENKAPQQQQLASLDALVFDVQDAGARFYTYSSTLGLCMEAASKYGIEFIVLDRPNPIGGLAIEGPNAEDSLLSFVAYHTVPTRHGLTSGELAMLYNSEKQLHCQLNVVPCRHWRRDMLWDATGLAWINPSPNMRSFTQALLYPGICPLEVTNVSVGRGTDTPFEHFGAPWLDALRFADTLRAMNLPGVSFVPVHFTPQSSTFAGIRCAGINVVISDRARFHPVLTGLAVMEALLKTHRSEWNPHRVETLLGSRELLLRLQQGASARGLTALLKHDREVFEARRRPCLIYG